MLYHEHLLYIKSLGEPGVIMRGLEGITARGYGIGQFAIGEMIRLGAISRTSPSDKPIYIHFLDTLQVNSAWITVPLVGDGVRYLYIPRDEVIEVTIGEEMFYVSGEDECNRDVKEILEESRGLPRPLSADEIETLRANSECERVPTQLHEIINGVEYIRVELFSPYIPLCNSRLQLRRKIPGTTQWKTSIPIYYVGMMLSPEPTRRQIRDTPHVFKAAPTSRSSALAFDGASSLIKREEVYYFRDIYGLFVKISFTDAPRSNQQEETKGFSFDETLDHPQVPRVEDSDLQSETGPSMIVEPVLLP